MRLTSWLSAFATRRLRNHLVTQSKKRARKQIGQRPEWLEDRTLLSISTPVLVGGTVVFNGDAASANSITFSVDGGGHLQHNLGGSFASTIDLDSVTAGVQSLLVSDITSLTYTDQDATDDDTVTFNTSVFNFTNASFTSLTVNAGVVNLTSSADILTTGTGSVSLTTTKNISLASGTSITTGNGGITLSANASGTATGNFSGIDVNNATISSTTGNITLSGHGGNAAGGDQNGVEVQAGGVVGSGTSGTVSVTGFGGAGAGIENVGVLVTGTNSKITSGSGPVQVTGTGGGSAGASFSRGVAFTYAGVITSGGLGTVTVMGTGGVGSGGGHMGVYGFQPDSQITSGGGQVFVTGTGGVGDGANRGIYLDQSSLVTAGGTAAVTVTGTGGTGTGTHEGVVLQAGGSIKADSTINVTGTGTASANGIWTVDSSSVIALTGATGTITAVADKITLVGAINATSAGTVNIHQETNGTAINLGASDSSGVLGLDTADLGKVTAGTINIGDTNSGLITVSVAITRTASTNLVLTTGTDKNIVLSVAGALNSLGGNVTLTTSGTGAITSGSASTVITAGVGTISLNAGSVGIGASGSPVVLSGTNLHTSTTGNGNQFLSASGSITIDATGLSAGTGIIELDVGTFALGGSERIDSTNNNTKLHVNGATFALTTFNETVNTLTLTGGSITGSGGVLTSTNAFDVQSGSISAILDSTSGLTKTTGGTVTLSGANTYAGATTISAGTLAIGASGVIPDGAGKGDVSVTGTLAFIGNFNETINGLTGAGTVTKTTTAGTSTLTVGANNATSNFGGVLSNSTGTLALTKTGTGTLTLSGANTYVGTTLISNGTLALSNASNNNISGSTLIDVQASTILNVAALNSGRLDLASGQTLEGKGTVTGAVKGLSGSTVAPGESIGVLNTGDLTLAPGSTYTVEIATPYNTAGVGYDQTIVTGTLNVSGATLTLTGGTLAGTPGQILTIISNDGSDVTAPFAGFAEGATVTSGSFSAIISYVGGDGNDVTLTVTGAAVYTGTAVADTFELKEVTISGLDYIQYFVGGVLTDQRLSSTVTAIQVDGGDGNDTLTINYAGSGGFFNKPVTFNGQNPTTTPGDKLIISGGSFTNIANTLTNAHDGTINLDGTLVSYTGLEPVLIGVVGVGSLTFTLPAGGNTAFLEDDGTGGNGMIQLRSSPITFEVTTFTVPTGSLTINGGAGADSLTVTSIADFHASLTVAEGAGDSITLSNAISLGSAGSNGNLSFTADTINLAANINTDAGTNSGTVTLTGAVVVSDGASVTIDTNGGGTDAAISLTSTLAGTAGGGSESVSFDSGTATVTVSGAVGPDINGLTVTQSGGSTFSSTVSATSVTLTNTAGAITFLGDVTATTLSTAAQTYSVVFQGASNTITNPVTFSNTSGVTLGVGGGDVFLFNGGVVSTASTTTVNGTVKTSGDVATFGAVTLTGNSSFDTTNAGGVAAGNGLTLGAVTGATFGLSLNAGTGGNISGTTVSGVGTLTVAQSASSTFSGAVGATTVTLTNSVGSITFNGALTATTLNTANQSYNVALNAGGTIATAVTFSNTGTVTLGNDAVDNLAFTGGVTATAPSSKSIAGTVSAAGTGVINLGTTSINVTASANVGGASTGQITLGNATLADGATLTVGTGTATPISTGSLTGTAGGAVSNVTFNTTNTLAVSGAVGTDIGTLTVTQSGGTTFSSSVSVASVQITDTTDGNTVAFQGDLTVTTGMVVAANGAYNVSITGTTNSIAGATTFGNTGTLVLGNGAGDSLAFTGGVSATAPSNQTIAGTISAAGTGVIFLGAANVTVTDNTTIGGTSTGQITLGATGINEGAGGVTLTLGAGAATPVTVASITGNNTGAGVSNVTINTTGVVSITGAVGTDIGTVTVTQSGGTTFGNTVAAATVTLTNTTGAITFTGNLTATTLNTANQGYSVVMQGASNTITNAVTFSNTGGVTLGNGGDVSLFNGGVVSTASTTTLNGDVRSSADAIQLGAVTLAGNSAVDSTNNGGSPGGNDLTLGAVTGATFNLTLNAGTSAGSDIAGTTVSGVGTLTITQSDTTTFSGAVSAATVTLTNTNGAITFNGAVTATTFNTAVQAYSVALNAGGSITNAVTFSNTGTVTLGNDAADNLAFTGGVTATAPSSKNIAGTISAAGTGVINLGTTAVAVTANATVGGTSTGQITLANATLADNVTLTLGAGAATPITTGSLSGTAAGTSSNITINTTGVVSVTGAVGTDIGTLTVTQSGGTTFSSTVNATTVTLTNTTGSIAFNGALTATTLTTAAAGFNVALNAGGTVTNDVNFVNTGTVTLGNDNADVLTFVGGLATAGNATNPSSTNIAGTVRTNGQQMDLGPATVTATSTVATNNTVAGGAVLNFSTVAGGGFSLTVNGGTGGNVTFNGALTNLLNIAVDGAAVDLNGKLTASGTVRLTGKDNVTIDAAIDPTTVLLQSDDDVIVSAAVTATTSITIQAGQDGTGNATIAAAGSLNSTDLVITAGATSGNISLVGDLTATGQSTLTSQDLISQTGGTFVSPNLLLQGAADATLNRPLNDFDTVAADLDPGSVSLTDKDDIIVGTVGGTSGILTGNPATGGAVIITATSGTITVNQAISTASGSGGAIAITGSVSVNAAIAAGGGNVTLSGSTAATSDLHIDAALTSSASMVLTANRDIFVNAQVQTTGVLADITLTADSDANGVGGLRVEILGQVLSNNQVTMSGSDLFVTGGGVLDSVVIVADGSNVQVQGAGAISISANGVAPDAADITVNGRINATGTATVAITAEHSVTFASTGDINTAGGLVMITADNATVLATGGAITQADDAVIDSGNGTISLSADGDITLGNVTTTNSSVAAVTILSTSGGVVDGGNTDVDIVADSGRVVITAVTGIGTGGALGAIETTISSLDASVTGAGSISIAETNAITLFDVDTANGSIAVTASGTITATDVVSTTDNNANDIVLTANGAGSSITVTTITAGAAGDVTLTAGNDVLDSASADTNLLTADVLTIDAANGTDDLVDGIVLDTTVASLDASVAAGVSVGNIDIDETNGITLTDVDTGNGSITVVADGTIVATDVASLNNADTNDIVLTAVGAAASISVTLINAGAAGDVTLTAGNDVLDSDSADANLITADVLTVDAANGTDDATDGIVLDTTVASLNGSVTAGAAGGNIDIDETNGITLTDVDTFNGSITVVADGTITATDVASLNDADANDISLTANTGGSILVASVNAGTTAGDVTLTAAAAIDETIADGTADIIGQDLRFVAATGIGTAGKIEINGVNLAATTASGDISLNDTAGGLIITTITTIGVSITAGAVGDNIDISTSSPLTVNSPVSDNGGGNITLAANGAVVTDDLTINADVTATGGSGNIFLYAGHTISLSATTDVTATNSGAILLSAGTDYNNGGALQNGINSGSVSMTDGSTVQSQDGNITLRAPENVTLSVVNANSNGGTAGDVVVTADYAGVGGGLSDTAGTITDVLTGEAANITGNQATLSAATGIGSSATVADDIDTNIVTLVATNTTSGDIVIRETNTLIVGGTGVRTLGGNGNINLFVTAGSLTLNGVLATNVNGDARLDVATSVSQSIAGVVTADQLGIRAGGNVDLYVATTNDVNDLAITTNGLIEFRDQDNFTVTTVAADPSGAFLATSGITSTSNDIYLETNGGTGTLVISQPINAGTADLRLEASSTVTQTAAISASGLALTDQGPFNLSLATNSVTTLAANSVNTIDYVNAGSLIVGTVTIQTTSVGPVNTVGIATVNTDVRLTATIGSIAIHDTINLNGGGGGGAGGSLDLLATQGATQQGGDNILANMLLLRGTGVGTASNFFNLPNTTNNVAIIAASLVNGAVTYYDADALTVGISTVTTLAGMTDATGITVGNPNVVATGGDVFLRAGQETPFTGLLTVTQIIDTDAGTFGNLTLGGGVVFSGAGNTNVGSGDIDLEGGAAVPDIIINNVTVHNMTGGIATYRPDRDIFINRSVTVNNGHFVLDADGEDPVATRTIAQTTADLGLGNGVGGVWIRDQGSLDVNTGAQGGGSLVIAGSQINNTPNGGAAYVAPTTLVAGAGVQIDNTTAVTEVTAATTISLLVKTIVGFGSATNSMRLDGNIVGDAGSPIDVQVEDTLTLNSTISLTDEGNITIDAEDMVINTSSAIIDAKETTANNDSGVVWLRNRTAGRQIDLGGGLGGARLTLTNAELNRINQAEVVRIGRNAASQLNSAGAGRITVSALNINLTPDVSGSQTNLHLITSADIVDGGANGAGGLGTITETNLALEAVTGIDLHNVNAIVGSAGNDVDHLAILLTGGDAVFKDRDDVDFQIVDFVAGAVNAVNVTNNLTMIMGGNLTQTNAVVAGGLELIDLFNGAPPPTFLANPTYYLPHSSNNINQLEAYSQQSVNITNATTLTVGTVNNSYLTFPASGSNGVWVNSLQLTAPTVVVNSPIETNNELGFVTFDVSSLLDINNNIYSRGKIEQIGTGAVTIDDVQLRTTDDNITFLGGVTLDGASLVTATTMSTDANWTTPFTGIPVATNAPAQSGGGSIVFNSTLRSTPSGDTAVNYRGNDLTLEAGSGDVTFTGQVGGAGVHPVMLAVAGRVGIVNIIDVHSVTATTGFSANAFYQQAGDGLTVFNGFVQTNRGNATNGNGIDITTKMITLNAGMQTTSAPGSGATAAIRFNNSGTLSIVAGAGSINSDGPVSQVGTGDNLVGGNIITTNDNISFASDTYLSGTPIQINSGTGADVSFAKRFQINNKTVTIRDKDFVDLGTVTAIAGGVLNVFVNNTATRGSVQVGSGEIFTGAGTLNTDVAILTGGTLGPAMDASGLGTGILTINGNTTFASGAVYAVDLNGLVAGTNYDQVVPGAGFTFTPGAGSILAPSRPVTFNPAIGTVLRIVDGNVAILPNAFSNAANGAFIYVNGLYFQVAYDGGTGDITLTRQDAATPTTYIIDDDGYTAGPVAVGGTFSVSPNNTSSWSPNTVQGRGYGNDLRFSLPVATDTATWAFTGLPAGNYRVSTTWYAHINRATNALFTVSGGVGSPTANLNQRNSPDDFTSDGATWEDIVTTYTVTGAGTLTVTLSGSGADGYVIADAVRIQPVSTSAAEIQVLDYTTPASPVDIADGTGVLDFGTVNQGGGSTSKTIRVYNTGLSPLLLSSASITAPAGFIVTGYAPQTIPAATSASLATNTSFIVLTVTLDDTTAGNYDGQVSFNTNDFDENPFNFRVKGAVLSGTTRIADNPRLPSNSGVNNTVNPPALVGTGMTYGETGGWHDNSDYLVGYQQDLRFAAANTAATATWTFNGVVAGTYRVSVTYRAESNRASNASFTVDDGAGGLAALTTTINQRVQPNQFTDANTGWIDLVAAYGSVTSGTITVTLNALGSNGFVIADAIRIERTGPLDAAQGAAENPTSTVLTPDELQATAEAAIARWQAASLTTAQQAALNGIVFAIQDLPDAQLGAETQATIFVDPNAAGYGWYVDPTPYDDSEFGLTIAGTELGATDLLAADQIDLLTVLMHEVGHRFGLDDVSVLDDAHTLMAETLDVGTRRLVVPVAVAEDDADPISDKVSDEVFYTFGGCEVATPTTQVTPINYGGVTNGSHRNHHQDAGQAAGESVAGPKHSGRHHKTGGKGESTGNGSLLHTLLKLIRGGR